MAFVFITGGAGFIGYHLQQQLITHHNISAIDLLDDDNKAAALRIKQLPQTKKGNICSNFLDILDKKPDIVVHLAAETGIAPSLLHPQKYFDTNVAGTFNVLEQCRKNNVKYLIYASSSSVYASGQEVTDENADTSHQLSFYGTTKKVCETMIENYCKQFGLVAIGLRFFTVYGSWTRPDMAAYKFMTAITNNKPITIYNNGNVFRDFTHVSDIVKSIELLVGKIFQEKEGTHQVFNIGHGNPVSVKNFAETIASYLNKNVSFENAELPLNELPYTHADNMAIYNYTKYKPVLSLNQGVKEMTSWFLKTNY